jgi:hypothetical protein
MKKGGTEEMEKGNEKEVQVKEYSTPSGECL